MFRRRLKVLSVSDAVTLDGKVFQMRSAAKNVRSTIVVRHKNGVIKNNGRHRRRSQPL